MKTDIRNLATRQVVPESIRWSSRQCLPAASRPTGIRKATHSLKEVVSINPSTNIRGYSTTGGRSELQNVRPLVRILIFLSLILVSCTSSRTVDSVEPVKDVNKTITVIAPVEINTFRLNDFVRIAVRNNSDHEVRLSPESTVEMSMMGEGRATNVSNLLNSSNREILLAPQSQKDTNQTLYTVIPDIQVKKTVTIRIIVKGADQTTNQEVSGYVDITLKP